MERLGEELREQLRRLGPQATDAGLVEAWPAAVGEEIARNAWPARLQADGTLVVHVSDSIWGFELTQRALEIRARLPGSPALRFVPGPLPEGDLEPSEGRPAPSPPTSEQVREAESWAAQIDDAELRELVARAAAASLARAAADRPV